MPLPPPLFPARRRPLSGPGARLLLAGALLLPDWASAAPTATVSTPQVKAELVAHAPQGVQPGQPLWLGLKIEHAPHWHTYWQNPGDSGLPTTLAWQLPAGFQPGAIGWPTPKRLPIGPLMNFGYEGTVLLPVAVQVPAGFSGSSLPVKLRADWLVCKDVCIPEGGDFALEVPVQAATSAHGSLFDATRAAAPQDVAGAQARAEVQGGELRVRIDGLPAAWQGQALAFLPETAGVIVNSAKPVTAWQGGSWTAQVPIDPQRSESPTTMPVVLTRADAPAGLRVALAVTTPWPKPGGSGAAAAGAGATDTGSAPAGGATPTSAAATGAAAPAPVAPGGPGLGLWLSIGLALVGGLILNAMPCVFPVLALKVLGFARGGADRRALLAGGLAYTAGVVSSFVALAGLLLALRAGGEQLGWGFQLQQPAVVAGLALLFTLIGLNLAGVFELRSVLPSSWATAQARHPVADHFLTGVLAVGIASPCTAPFMGASLGAAMAMPAAQALTVFAALGLGMAAPYLAASAWPALARRLPRPGPWMQQLRVALAFPMFATVVWLAWVLGVQTGVEGVTALLGLLVAVAFAAWALGSPLLAGRARAGFAAVALLLLAGVALWSGPALREGAATALAPADAATSSLTGTPGAEAGWQPWSAERVAEAQAQGRTVFVDFTAAWCVSCQFNKRTTLATRAVKDGFSQRQVLLLRADWTRRDAAITAQLGRFGRSGVPVYAVYTPGAPEPRLLSEILSVAEVLQAIGAEGPPG